MSDPNSTAKPESQTALYASAGSATDTERLDWLIKQGPPEACEGAGLNEAAWDAAYGKLDGDHLTDRQCLRAAIDAAMTLNDKDQPRPTTV